MIKVVYVAPPFEEVQNEITRYGDNNVPLECSLHSDVSLLLRIDSLRADAQTLSLLKESMQPMIDNSNYRQQFEDTFGSLTDDDLISSCPSRYVQTASEKLSYLKELAEKDKQVRADAAKSAKEKEEKERIDRENAEFQSKLMEIFK